MSCVLWADKLDAYVDNEGSRDDFAAVEDHMRACPDCARDALGRIQLKRATQAAAMRFKPSPEFRLRVETSIRKNRRSPWALAWKPALLAATAMILLVAASALVFTRHVDSDRAIAEIVDQHVATMASANPVDVISTDRHTVKPWFQGKLPFSFNLPELGATQFKLIGGKVAYLNRSPAAQLLFTSGKHNVSVFIEQDQPDSTPSALLAGSSLDKGFKVETWSVSGLRYIEVSDTNTADMRALAELLKTAAKQ